MIELIRNGFLSVSIDTAGAELVSVRNNDGTEYMWNADEAYWPRHSPLLFPFVGRLEGKAYIYRGRRYEIELHGFAKTSSFSVSRKGDASVTFCLSADASTLAIYPFDFRLSVTYSLEGRRLEERIEVANGGKTDMIYGIGGHPGFSVPLEQDLAFEDYSISFPDSSSMRRRIFSPSGLDTGREEPFLEGNPLLLRHDLFSNDAIVLSSTGGRTILSSEKDSRRVEVRSDAPWCGIWHSTGKAAPFVCIEPWWTLPGRDGVPCDIEQRSDLLRLAPSESREHRIVYLFD